MDSMADPAFFGLTLSTHRARELGPDATTFFQYEAIIAAISILFFRSTLHFKYEHISLRWFFSLLLACLAYTKKNYVLITAVEIFSYAVSWLLLKRDPKAVLDRKEMMIRLLSIAASAIASLVLSNFIFSSNLGKLLALLTPGFVLRTLHYLFPIEELRAAYNIMAAFADPRVLQKQLSHLLFVTFHIQIGIGYMGIDMLRKEQHRRNQLIRMDVPDDDDDDNDDKRPTNGAAARAKSTTSKMERAHRFQKSAVPFIFFVALPYMIQVITYGNINKFAFVCLQHDLHRTIRLNELFDRDNLLTAMATESPTSPEAYATSMDAVVSRSYDLFNRKLFSLPKVLLLPGVMSRQPLLVVQVFPFIFLSDWIKAGAVSFMTTKIEELQKEIQELNAIRSKVETFDIKNAELLQRSGKGATDYTQRRWEELTIKVQSRLVMSDLITRSKGFFQWIQRNFVFTALVDCALANLIVAGKIVSAEVFVFTRAIEDAVDMILMRTRSEAELARMMTEIEKLQSLVDIWERSRTRALLPCTLAPPHQKNLVLRNLHYSRGTASARADHVALSPGVYALTGSNGSGKSTLFRILMSCSTNEKSIDLPRSINLHTPMEPLMEEDDLLREAACEAVVDESGSIQNQDCDMDLDESGKSRNQTLSNPAHIVPKLSIAMPSSHVVEISQTFYWPLYSRPIDWIYQEHVSETCDPAELERRTKKVAQALHSLEFFQSGLETVEENGEAMDQSKDISPGEATIERILKELQDEKEDWFGDLSGGQKSKVELVRKVFLHEKCPDVLLVDETMAPLDPASKAIVMAKLKDFCRESIIIVIYHTDVGQGKEVEGREIECIPANNFFDKNIHLEMGIVHVRDTC